MSERVEVRHGRTVLGYAERRADSDWWLAISVAGRDMRPGGTCWGAARTAEDAVEMVRRRWGV